MEWTTPSKLRERYNLSKLQEEDLERNIKTAEKFNYELRVKLVSNQMSYEFIPQ